jgi:hypothetical protein
MNRQIDQASQACVIAAGAAYRVNLMAVCLQAAYEIRPDKSAGSCY